MTTEDEPFRSPIPWPKIPNPFECQLRHFRWYHCGQHSVVDITTVANCFGHFWFSEILPSFQEITRKQVTGSGKCGFGLRHGRKNPISILWGDTPGVGRANVIGAIIRPLTTGLFVWWASQALSEALSMAQTMMYVEDAAKQHDKSLLSGGGVVLLPTGETTGAIGPTQIFCAKILSQQPNVAVINAPAPGVWRGFLAGHILTNSYTLHSFDLWVGQETDKLGTFSTGGIGPGSVVNFKVPYSGEALLSSIQNHWDADASGNPLNAAHVILDRWVAEWEPDHFEPDPPCGDGLLLRQEIPEILALG